MNHPLLIRFISNQCTGPERQQVEQWLEKDPRNRQLLEEMRTIWDATGGDPLGAADSDPDVGFDVVRDWQRLRDRIGEELPRPARSTGIHKMPSAVRSGWGQLLRTAAVILIASVIGIFAWQNYSHGPEDASPEMREIVMARGQRANIVLPDGTNLILNADSRIRVPEAFSAEKREVQLLEGEAWFDVARDPDRPFLIQTAGSVVEVLGTAFSVRSYPEDHGVRVVVQEGRVSFGPEADENSRIVLTADQMAHYQFSNRRLIAEEVEDVELYLSWTDGYLKFKNTPLSEVALQLERKYNVSVKMADPELADLRLTAELRGRSIHNVLNVIAASMDIRYQEVNGQDIIFLKP